jgi:uncharacterized paraquat-inducible protein A
MEFVLALATVLLVALGLAYAPGRWRRAQPRPVTRPRDHEFLAVCSRCAEIVEADAGTEDCPGCGAVLTMRRRIVDRRSESAREPVAP